MIDAPVARVWRALCDPNEVQQWDGAVPIDVPAGYPQPGQHARWRIAVIPWLPVTLHDRVGEVVANVRLRAELRYAFVVIDETYELEPIDDDRCRLTARNVVTSRVPGLGPWAERSVRTAVTRAMARLERHCGAPG
jgi:hypothetical protein